MVCVRLLAVSLFLGSLVGGGRGSGGEGLMEDLQLFFMHEPQFGLELVEVFFSFSFLFLPPFSSFFSPIHFLFKITVGSFLYLASIKHSCGPCYYCFRGCLYTLPSKRIPRNGDFSWIFE